MTRQAVRTKKGVGDLQSQGGGPLSCSRSHNTQRQPQEGSVPDKRRRIGPEVVVCIYIIIMIGMNVVDNLNSV